MTRRRVWPNRRRTTGWCVLLWSIALAVQTMAALAQDAAPPLPSVNYPLGDRLTGRPEPTSVIVVGPTAWVMESGVRTQYVYQDGYWWFWGANRVRHRAPDQTARWIGSRRFGPPSANGGRPVPVAPQAMHRPASLPNPPPRPILPHPVLTGAPTHAAAPGPHHH